VTFSRLYLYNFPDSRLCLYKLPDFGYAKGYIFPEGGTHDSQRNGGRYSSYFLYNVYCTLHGYRSI